MPTGIPKNGTNRGWIKKGTVAWNKGLKFPNLSKENNWNWKGGQVHLKCKLCGKDYLKDKCQAKRSKFCSHSCKAKFLHTGSKNSNWKGGISKEKDRLKSSEFYKKWRLKVFQRDRFTCKQCEYRSKKSKAHGDKTSDIHAHHIETIEEHPELCLKVGNGITLCINCHRLTYGKEEKFVTVFKEILNDFMPNKTKV